MAASQWPQSDWNLRPSVLISRRTLGIFAPRRTLGIFEAQIRLGYDFAF
jgi:hypothetical protein